METRLSRRGFLRRAATASAGMAIPLIVSGRALGADGKVPASERVTLGFIGAGGMNNAHLGGILGNPRCTVLAVCDVDQSRRMATQQRVGSQCAAYNDYRQLLDRKDIDAVFVATPDHWHTLISIDACKAGKDIYCEKPLTLTIGEGKALLKTVRRYGRVFQTGSQQRSSGEFRHAVELVRNGRIGRVHTVWVTIGGAPGGDYAPDEPVPAGLDWNMWLGPAPYSPYNRLRHPYNFRWFYDYSGGKMTDWGAHHNDIAQWGLGMDGNGPEWIEATGVFPTEGLYDVATSFEVHYTYSTGQLVKCVSDPPADIRFGVTFMGTDGWVWVTRGEIETEPRELRDEVFGPDDTRVDYSNDHHGNFLDCIQTRERPICDVEVGHRSVSVCHLGNIALRTGRKLHWDPAREEFIDDADANRWVDKPYRAPWHL